MWYGRCTMASGDSVSSNQKPAAQGAGLREVRVPRETHRVGSLEYIERKPWKYKTKHRYCKSIPADYLITSSAESVGEILSGASVRPLCIVCWSKAAGFGLLGAGIGAGQTRVAGVQAARRAVPGVPG